jgi:hypothetical protein
MQIELRTIFASYDKVALRWSLDEPVRQVVTFEVWRSESSTTGFVRVGVTRSLVWVDRVNLLAKFKPMYYQVRALIANHPAVSNTAAITNAPDETVLRFQRRERFQLGKYDGVPAFVYTRRRTGQVCPRCVGDKEMGDLGVDCMTCFGTGFRGGYYPPVPIYVAHQDLKTEGSNIQQNYVKDSSSTNLWTSNWTIMSPEDVVIEMSPPNQVWRVTGMQKSERFRAPSRQIFTANEADKGHAIYRLPIPDFDWPDRREIFFQDFDNDPPRDFDTMWQERLDAYVQDTDVRDENEPAPQYDQPQGQAGKRNSTTGRYT